MSARARYVSLFKFRTLPSPQRWRAYWYALLKRYAVMGTVLLAEREGINAQLSVPCDELGGFLERIRRFTPLAGATIAVEDSSYEHEQSQAFSTTRVSLKANIINERVPAHIRSLWRVTDSLASRDLDAEQWNAVIASPSTIVLDVRNAYESAVGRFERATLVPTDAYAQAFEHVEAILHAADPTGERPVALYCTGGIRCVKVAAHLHRVLGRPRDKLFTLRGGITSYVAQIKRAQRAGAPPSAMRFLGLNKVFDHRNALRVTEHVLATCRHCASPATRTSNCVNNRCNEMCLLCDKCNPVCNSACASAATATAPAPRTVSGRYQRLHEWRGAAPARKLSTAAADVIARARGSVVCPAHEQYASAHCSHDASLDSLLDVIAQATHAEFGPVPARMLTPLWQTSLLRTLARALRARTILELGTFTGFAAVCLCEALDDQAAVPCELVTCERDARAAAMARGFLARAPSVVSGRVRATLREGPALATLGALTTELSAGAREPFDLVYCDADKAAYRDYVDALLAAGLVRRGGLIVLDNTLFRGRVARLDGQAGSAGTNARHERVASAMRALNQALAQDARVLVTLLPSGDGITLIERRY